MSCGGLDLLAGSQDCGCGPGANIHESYTGSDRANSAANYATSSLYQGRAVDLPQTAVGRSYSTEKVYTPTIIEPQQLERIYVSTPTEMKSNSSIDLTVQSHTLGNRSLAMGTDGASEQPMLSNRRIYERSIGELEKMEDTYAKTRLLERRIGEALMEQPKVLNPLVN